MLEDDMNHFSLVRFIQDFKELDSLVNSVNDAVYIQ
jgi:hypothetical protein